MTNQAATETQQKFAAALFAALSRSLTETAGSPWQVGSPDAEAAAAAADAVRIQLTLDGSLKGEALLEFQRTEALMLASKLLGQPGGDAEEFGGEQSEALVKAVGAAGMEFARMLAADHGAFSCEAAAATDQELAPGLTNIGQVNLADDDGNRASAALYVDVALAEALAALVASQAQDGQSPSADTFTGQVPATGPGGAMQPPVNLKLVMDVELNVTLRFGKRQLTLREVIDLTSGSVIELDRQVDEPVELLLDGEVIARGEAVVIDGNYGLRVTEVPQPLSYEVLR